MDDQQVEPGQGEDPESKETQAEEEEFKPPKDGSWVPRERIKREQQKYESRIDALEAQVQAEVRERIAAEERAKAQAEQQEKQQPPAKHYTRTELQKLVDAQQISEEQAEAYWEKQLRDEFRAEFLTEIEQRDAAREKARIVREQISAYKKHIPDVAVVGSESWNRVKQEYEALVALGDEQDVVTEVKALRAAFGPPEKIEERTRQSRETHAETSGGGDDETGDRSRDTLGGLSNRYKQFYKEQIEKGQYTSWDDPKLKKELEYIRSKST